MNKNEGWVIVKDRAIPHPAIIHPDGFHLKPDLESMLKYVAETFKDGLDDGYEVARAIITPSYGKGVPFEIHVQETYDTKINWSSFPFSLGQFGEAIEPDWPIQFRTQYDALRYAKWANNLVRNGRYSHREYKAVRPDEERKGFEDMGDWAVTWYPSFFEVTYAHHHCLKFYEAGVQDVGGVLKPVSNHDDYYPVKSQLEV